MHTLIPSEQRATVISFDSLVSSVGSMGGQGGLGYLAQMRSLSAGYMTGGLLGFLAIPVIMLLRRLGDGADEMAPAKGEEG